MPASGHHPPGRLAPPSHAQAAGEPGAQRLLHPGGHAECGPEAPSPCDILPGVVCAVTDASSLVQVAQRTGRPRPHGEVASAVVLSAAHHWHIVGPARRWRRDA